MTSFPTTNKYGYQTRILYTSHQMERSKNERKEKKDQLFKCCVYLKKKKTAQFSVHTHQHRSFHRGLEGWASPITLFCSWRNMKKFKIFSLSPLSRFFRASDPPISLFWLRCWCTLDDRFAWAFSFQFYFILFFLFCCCCCCWWCFPFVLYVANLIYPCIFVKLYRRNRFHFSTVWYIEAFSWIAWVFL